MLGRLRFSIREAIEHSENIWRERFLMLVGHLRIPTKTQNLDKLHHLLQKELEEEMHDDPDSQKTCNDPNRSPLPNDSSAKPSSSLRADAGMCRT